MGFQFFRKFRSQASAARAGRSGLAPARTHTVTQPGAALQEAPATIGTPPKAAPRLLTERERMIERARRFAVRLGEADIARARSIFLSLSTSGERIRLREADLEFLACEQTCLSVVYAVEFERAPGPADDLLDPLREADFDRSDIVELALDVQACRARILAASGHGSIAAYFSALHPELVLDLACEASVEEAKEALSAGGHDESWMLLFDPWNYLIGSISYSTLGRKFSWAEFKHFDPALSRRIHYFDALLHIGDGGASMMSPFWLGHHFNGGWEGTIDPNAAAFWFEIASRLGHGVAPLFISEILEAQLSPSQKDLEKNRAYLDSLVERAHALDFHCARSFLNRRNTFGHGSWNDQDKAVAHYEEVANGDFWAPPQIGDLYRYALRATVFGTPGRSAAELTTLIRAKADENNLGAHLSSIDPNIRNLEDLVAKQGGESDGYRRTFNIVASFLADKYFGQEEWQPIDAEYASLIADMRQINDPDIRAQSFVAASEALWAATELAREEGWYIGYHVHQLFERVNAERLGLDLKALKRSALQMGPFYNAIDPANALPVLGELLPASRSTGLIKANRARQGWYVPAPGVRAVNQIRLDAAGEINFLAEASEAAPALLLEEDFEVVLALAFGERDGPIWPTLSLEQDVDRILEDSYAQFKAKIWNPAWLGHTDFGRSFYTVDRLTGALTWDPYAFSMASPERAFAPAFPAHFEHLRSQLLQMGGADRISWSRMINVSPEHMEVSARPGRDSGGRITATVDIGRRKMRINGAYISKVAGVESRELSWNDGRYRQGRLTQFLTDHYQDIELAIPVFERMRQLMALLYGVFELRKHVSLFDLSPGQAGRIRQAMSRYQALAPLGRDELVLKSQPFALDAER